MSEYKVTKDQYAPTYLEVAKAEREARWTKAAGVLVSGSIVLLLLSLIPAAHLPTVVLGISIAFGVVALIYVVATVLDRMDKNSRIIRDARSIGVREDD